MAIYDRDYLTTLPLLYEKANEYSDGEWNKYNDDVGDTILKLLATSSHTVDYYFRRFLSALILPNDDWDQKALVWELTGYKPNYLRADYLMVQLYWPDCGLNSYVPLYQYTPFKITADGKEYVFLCAQDYLIPPLTTRTNVRLVNGSLVTIEQDYTAIQNNKIKLSDNDIDYDLVTVVVSGTKWTQVRNVFYSPKTERIYSVHKEDDGTYLYLHSSWQDYVDAYDTSFIIRFVESYYDFNMFTDDCMQVEFQTELLTIDGDDVSQFYKIIPLLNSDEAFGSMNLLPSTTEGNRAITTLDFESNAALFPGIASCRAYDWNTPEVCTTPFEVDLIACDAKGKLSEHMKQVLKGYLESISSPLINVKVIEPQFEKQDILVLLDIGDYRGTLAERELKKLVQRTLEDFYEIGNLPPGRVVKTKELNSLLLHADSRIYFVTTSFLNAPVRSPLLIPVLGRVITITSAEAFSYYDYGTGVDKGYVGLRRFEWGEGKDKNLDVNLFWAYTLPVNFIIPIDKLPLQVFDSGDISVSEPLFNIGSGEMPVADFGVGTGFVHVLETGGDPLGPEMTFVFETDGTSVLMRVSRTIETTASGQLKFENSQGAFYVEPELAIYVSKDDIQQLKNQLATAFNTIPGLVDADGNAFNITGDDIIFPDAVLGGSGRNLGAPNPLGDEIPALSQNTLIKDDNDLLTYSENIASTEAQSIEILSDEKRKSDSGTGTEREFVYIPYTESIKREILRSAENSEVRKINLQVKTSTAHSYQTYTGFTYQSRGKYIPDPEAYGELTFTANTYLSITDETTEFIPVRPDLYSEKASYDSVYYVRDIKGNKLHWYYVNTSPVHTVGGTHEIGYGISVGIKLLRDTGVYVETDIITSRGFIYSSELEPSDLFMLD